MRSVYNRGTAGWDTLKILVLKSTEINVLRDHNAKGEVIGGDPVHTEALGSGPTCVSCVDTAIFRPLRRLFLYENKADP